MTEYLAFAWCQHDARGGVDDFVGSASTLEGAQHLVEAGPPNDDYPCIVYDYGHIVTCSNGRFVRVAEWAFDIVRQDTLSNYGDGPLAAEDSTRAPWEQVGAPGEEHVICRGMFWTIEGVLHLPVTFGEGES